MSSNSVLMIGLKWLLIPVVMASLGYFLVGPQIGKVPTLKKGADKVEQLVRNSSEPPPPPVITPEEDKYADLKIEIGERGSSDKKPSDALSEESGRSRSQEEDPEISEPESTQNNPDNDVITIPDTPPVKVDGDNVEPPIDDLTAIDNN